MKVPATILIVSGALAVVGASMAGIGVLFGGSLAIVLPGFLQAIIG